MFGRDADDEGAEQRAADYADTLIPIYPATKDLPTWAIAKSVGVVVDTLGAARRPAARRTCARITRSWTSPRPSG